jgi:hypothetical protein
MMNWALVLRNKILGSVFVNHSKFCHFILILLYDNQLSVEFALQNQIKSTCNDWLLDLFSRQKCLKRSKDTNLLFQVFLNLYI